METSLVTYNKGLNRDVSKNKFSPENYFDATNIRVVTDEVTGTLAVSNEKGNILSFKVPVPQAVFHIKFSSDTDAAISPPVALIVTINGQSYSTNQPFNTISTLYTWLTTKFATWVNLGHYRFYNCVDYVAIVGVNNLTTVTGSPLFTITTRVNLVYNTGATILRPKIVAFTQLRDELIVFSTITTPEGVTPGGIPPNIDALAGLTSNGQIWRVPINSDGSVDNLTAGYLTPSYHLVYNEQLNFGTSTRLDVYANYETSEVGKVYFTDDNNTLRHLNVLDPDVLGTPIERLNIVPEARFGTITIDSVNDSGNYKAGMVQYSHQYYNLHGAPSSFASPSEMVHLTSSSETLADTKFYLGAPHSTPTGKSVSFTLSNLDKRFTNIRIVAIYYDTLTGTPEIVILSDQTMPESGTISLTDSGTSLKGTVTDVEFVATGAVDLTCKTLTTKDNLMVLGNITESFFDVDYDARAYRFDTNGNAVLDTTNGTTLTISSATATVPETHDCIQTKSDQYNYRYTKTNKRLGGEGPNIRYFFKLKEITADTSHSNTTIKCDSSNGYQNYAGWRNRQYVGYHRDEVYRFGIVFRDVKGRKSFVKWIADVKMPAMWEEDTVMTNTAAGTYHFGIQYNPSSTASLGNNYVYALGLEFEINNIPASVVSYQIVRCKREEWDKSILAQGMFNPADVNIFEGDGAYSASLAPVNVDNIVGTSGNSKVWVLDSPEINFFKKNFAGCDVKIQGVHGITSYTTIDPTTDSPYWYYKTYKVVPVSKSALDVTDQRIFGSTSYKPILAVGNYYYRNYAYRNMGGGSVGSQYLYAYKGTDLVVAFNDYPDVTGLQGYFTVPGVYANAGIAFANIEKDNANQYGGMSYAARYNNQYLACTQPLRESSVEVFGGDTFVCYYDYLYGIYDGAPPVSGTGVGSKTVLTFFPVETSINLDLRHDACWTHSPVISYDFKETAHTSSAFTQTTDLYLYNTVYSRQNDLTTFFSKPVNFSSNREFDTRLMASNPKFINEEIDSWTQYFAANFIDVDGTYGPLNRLMTHKNRIYFFQNKAFGWPNVNERALITPDETGTSLSLGKSGILDQVFYISRYAGTRHQFSVTATPNGLYWYDAVNNRFVFFDGEDSKPISEIKGVSSYLKNLQVSDFRTVDTTLDFIGVHSVYDVRLNRVLFTFKELNSPYEFTLSFSEMLQSFESFYSFKPCIYANYNDLLLSVDPTANGNVYTHHLGNVGEFYEDVYDSDITTLFNRDAPRIKLVTNLEYLLNTYTDSPQNFKTITIWNDYQTTGDVLLTSDNSGRRFRTWRYTVQRNNSGDDDRIRGDNVFIKFDFDNSTNKKFMLHDTVIRYISRGI